MALVFNSKFDISIESIYFTRNIHYGYKSTTLPQYFQYHTLPWPRAKLPTPTKLHKEHMKRTEQNRVTRFPQIL